MKEGEKQMLIKKIKKQQDGFKELYELGVYSIHSNYILLSDELFLNLSNGEFDVIRTDDKEYPFELVKEIDGMKFIALVRDEKYIEEVGK